MENSIAQKITDIHCKSCGAPASFDIVSQRYTCAYCGGHVGIRDAQQECRGFRKMRAERLRESLPKFHLASASCSGCGATVVFEENEAFSHCAFCGRSLVRKEYTDTEDLPESVIPFVLTEEEARERLRDWCEKNRARPEAKKLLLHLSELKSFYLPYELVRGPVHMQVSRMDGGGVFRCEGFLKEAFVSRSAQLDNLLLDGMEPFDIDAMKGFDFAYTAGHRVKISDLPDQELEQRAAEEAGSVYLPAVRKTLQTRAAEVRSDVSSALRIPVLLPVSYVAADGLMAAVNGQTGKVSVRAEKESHYYFLPWWLKALAATFLFCGALYGSTALFGMAPKDSALVTLAAGMVFVIVTLCLYSDTVHNRFAVEAGREIYTSGGASFRRERGKLVQTDRILERKRETPVYFMKLDGTERPVRLSFLSPWRVLRMALLSLIVLFLPVILALFVNGFDFRRLDIGGSAVWLCIAVPMVPICLLKYGLVELYQHPWIYTFSESGGTRRYRAPKKKSTPDKTLREILLRAVFVPPGCLAVWVCILSFIVMVYLTAGFT